MPRPQRGVPLNVDPRPFKFTVAVNIYFLSRLFLKRHSLHTRYLYVLYLLGAPSITMSEDDLSMRVRGEPNQEFYRKAKDKYKSFSNSARTEFQRLPALNSKQTLNTSNLAPRIQPSIQPYIIAISCDEEVPSYDISIYIISMIIVETFFHYASIPSLLFAAEEQAKSAKVKQ
jgi:hypothetical protein